MKSLPRQIITYLSCVKVSILSCQRSPSCVNIRIHGIGERGSYLLHNFPCQRECRAIYSCVSQLLGVPSQLLTLSTGVKILRHGLPLQTYLSDLNLSNGLSLYCNIIIPGGSLYGTLESKPSALESVVFGGAKHNFFGSSRTYKTLYIHGRTWDWILYKLCGVKDPRLSVNQVVGFLKLIHFPI